MSRTNTPSAARAFTHGLSSRASASTLCRTPVLPTTASYPPLPISTPTRTTFASAPNAIHATSQPELTPIWFNSSPPRFDLPGPGSEGPENDRKVKLGKTLRILQERLPSLLQSPLPQEVLSPNISLHLFPSTHPYLPTVSGRVAYIAALWTSPIAWNRVPIVGNVRLEILSERMISQPVHFSPKRPGAYGEQLVVKWRTASTKDGDEGLSLTEQGEQRLDAHLRGSQTGNEKKKCFTGLFVFEFDKEGRIISHTIEHVDENHERQGVGSTILGLTDWLLGGIKGRNEGLPSLCRSTSTGKCDK